MIITNHSNLPNLSLEKKIALDIETHDPNLKTKGPGAIRNDGKIVGIGIVTMDGNEWYIPEMLLSDRGIMIDWFKQWEFELILGQNILYDLEWLACYGIRFNPKYYLDTMFAEALLNPGLKKDLDSLAERYLKDSKKSDEVKNYLITYNIATERNWKNYIYKVPKELVGPYCLKDCSLVIDILRLQRAELIKHGLMDVFKKECSLIPILLEMKLKGVKVNQHKIKDYYCLINSEIKELKDSLGDLNVSSSKEVSSFFQEKGYALKKTLKGNYSVDNTWLEANKEDESVGRISRLRKLLKINSTFVEPYIDESRIHTQYHTLRDESAKYGTNTGRFSSSHPNMQNIPARESEFKEVIRGFFEPEKSHDWYSYDYSQIEYRLVVNFSPRNNDNGQELKRQYINNPETDFHKVVMDWTGLPRKEAKVANFLLVYGGWWPRLQEHLKCSEEEAMKIYNLYHDTFPAIKHTFFYYRKMAMNNNKEVRTIWNRRRVLDTSYDLNKSLNTFIQGSAADIMKQSMINLHKDGIFDSIGYPILTVHDELSFSLPKNVKKEILLNIKNIMENAGKEYNIQIPLLVNVEKGDNWGNLTEVTI